MRLPLALLSGFLLLAACGSDTSPTMDISGTANGDADGDRSGQADGAGPSPDGHPAGCKSDKECDSGICLKAMADGVCAEFCDGQGGCPYEGWGCFPTYDKSGPFQALCLPVEGVLCTPCASDADCTTLDGSFGALCLPVEDQGHFCGYPCIAHTDCPEGYVCKAFELPDGKLAGQCRPKGVQCVCNEVGKRLSWTVPCGFENEAGTCSGETVCPPAGAAVCSAPVPEVDECNGFDDDCNGVVDDGPTIGEECGHSNKGECRKGVIACVDGEEICDGAVMPVDEICDGKDNDCDWETDEDYPEQMQPCGTDVGACMPGTSLCQGGTLLCIDPVGPTEEICDAKDNDCDGKTDEELPGAGEPCGSDVGECEPGAMACLGGVWSCEGGVLPDTEICDGKDTDCDGEVDPLPCADDPVLYYRFEEDRRRGHAGGRRSLRQGGGTESVCLHQGLLRRRPAGRPPPLHPALGPGGHAPRHRDALPARPRRRGPGQGPGPPGNRLRAHSHSIDPVVCRPPRPSPRTVDPPGARLDQG